MTLYGRSDAGVGQSERDIPANMLQSAVAILAHLETEQLEKMNEDETEMINIIDDSEIVKSVQTEREDLVTSNKSIAEFNVSQEPTLSSKKELLRELYVTQGEIFASFDGKKQTLEKNTGATSLDTILAILQSEAATSDEASEEMAERFVDGSLPVEEFLTEFQAKRKQTHMQRIKSEKFQEMINQGLAPNGTQQQPQIQPNQASQQHQQQNNLSSQWGGSQPNSHLPSPSRAAPPPPPPSSSMPYPAQPPAGYPVYGAPPGHGAPQHPGGVGGGGYWGGQHHQQHPQPGVMTGPPPGSNSPYPLSQPPPQAGGPRGGWGQGRAPYQQQMPYMAMPQPHMPGGYR